MEQIESVGEQSPRARWSRIIDQQQSSGLPVAVFCRERSLPVSSYYGWRRKLRGGESRAGFVEAQVVADGEGGDQKPGGGAGANAVGVRIELTGGRQVLVTRGFDRQVLLEVMQVLEGAAS